MIKEDTSTNAEIENEINITVVFPDSETPTTTNGGFDTQDEFRDFLVKHNNGKWNAFIQAKPTSEKIQDYDKTVFVQAFPVHFPFGYSGIPGDTALTKKIDEKKNPGHLKRTRIEVLKKLLQHGIPTFHSPEFNLVVNNVIMKETIFASARLSCNVTNSGAISMGERFGNLTSTEMKKAISLSRKQHAQMYSSAPENAFLQTITATCRSLPHTNEATGENRTIYFSYLMKFGLPCIFLTVTPDDNRCFRVTLYSLSSGQTGIGIKPDDLTNDDILRQFKIRQQTRLNYPGLCAEEYARIMELIIKHVFGWDIENSKQSTTGMFGDILAWCLATEEQGRKTLHGHFLIFLKNWDRISYSLHKKHQETAYNNEGVMPHCQAVRIATKLYKTVCSANLFEDFKPPGVLSTTAVFAHTCNRGRGKKARFTINPATDNELREMRHKRKCHLHNGKIANCPGCFKSFTISEIVTNALKIHLNKKYEYPDNNRRLDAIVYHNGSDFAWTIDTPENQALRYFSTNALVNLHAVTHATRCFKKGSECYANLPEQANAKVTIQYTDEVDVWSDYVGHKENMSMFRICPGRYPEDSWMNAHNPVLTNILLCNTNVMVAMNGCSVFYVTGYNAKSNQKEENAAFEAVAKVVVRHMEKQVRDWCTLLLSGIY